MPEVETKRVRPIQRRGVQAKRRVKSTSSVEKDARMLMAKPRAKVALSARPNIDPDRYWHCGLLI